MGDTHYTELLLTDHNHAKSIYASTNNATH